MPELLRNRELSKIFQILVPKIIALQTRHSKVIASVFVCNNIFKVEHSTTLGFEPDIQLVDDENDPLPQFKTFTSTIQKILQEKFKPQLSTIIILLLLCFWPRKSLFYLPEF